MKRPGITVSSESRGKRIDIFLCEKYPRISRAQWQRRIEKGNVLINGFVCRASRKLNSGDLITFQHIPLPEPETAKEYAIIHEDEDLLIIDKPADLPVHPSGRYRNNTLYSLLIRERGEIKIHFINRIDRETSGLVILAKNIPAARFLHEQIKQDSTEKEYVTIVIGDFPEYYDAKGFIGEKNSLVKKKRFFIASDHPPANGWQSCRTEFFLIKKDQGLSLLRARLHSGRMHQIRATLCSLGFPIAGDTLYGIDEKMYIKMISGEMSENDWLLLRGKRSMLHSYRITINHPRQKHPITFTSEIPSDFPLR